MTYSRHERGAALAISLIFLLVLTILSIAAMSGSGLQERMAGGARDANLAFQSAESALLAGEAWIGADTWTSRPLPCTSACTAAGVWGTRVTINGSPVDLTPITYPWANFDWARNAQDFGGAGKQLPQVMEDPRYVVQQSGFRPDSFVMGSGDGVYFYTVTARALSRNEQHASILQTVYTRRF